MFSRLVYLGGPSSSVLESTGSAVAHRINWAQMMLWKLPQGFQFSLTGLLLIAIFTSRLAFGIATLPLALPGRHGLQSDDLGSWRRLQLLIWFLVGIAFLPAALLSFITITVPFILTSRLPSYVQSAWFSRLAPIIVGMVVLGIALCIMGREGRQTVRNSIRLPGLKWPLLALAFPIAIDVVISMGQYVLDRSHLRHHNSSRILTSLVFGSCFYFLARFSRNSFFAACCKPDLLVDTECIAGYSLSESSGQLFIFSRTFLCRVPLIGKCCSS